MHDNDPYSYSSPIYRNRFLHHGTVSPIAQIANAEDKVNMAIADSSSSDFPALNFSSSAPLKPFEIRFERKQKLKQLLRVPCLIIVLAVSAIFIGTSKLPHKNQVARASNNSTSRNYSPTAGPTTAGPTTATNSWSWSTINGWISGRDNNNSDGSSNADKEYNTEAESYSETEAEAEAEDSEDDENNEEAEDDKEHDHNHEAENNEDTAKEESRSGEDDHNNEAENKEATAEEESQSNGDANDYQELDTYESFYANQSNPNSEQLYISSIIVAAFIVGGVATALVATKVSIFSLPILILC